MKKLFFLIRFLGIVFVFNLLIWEPAGIISGLAQRPIDPWSPIVLVITLLIALVASA